MRKTIFLLLLLVAGVSGVGLGQTTPSAENGKAIYGRWCVYCHGAVAPRLPSVMLLCQVLLHWASNTKAGCQPCLKSAVISRPRSFGRSSEAAYPACPSRERLKSAMLTWRISSPI